jgi:hypothetical protein
MIATRIDHWRLDASTMQVDPETGWLTMDGTAALVGVMDYGEQMEFVPESTLADSESLLAAPLTVQHPPKNLDLETTRKYQVGTVLSAGLDGEKLRVRIRVTDSEAVAAIQSGTRELSPGYQVELDPSPGVWAGQKYDAIQTKRRYNHLALVDAARGGRQARLDSWRADGALIQRTDSMETVTIDGVEFQVPPEVAAIVTAWQASQAPAADAEESAVDAAGATAPASAAPPAHAAPAAGKTPSSITVKMDEDSIAAKVEARMMKALRQDRELERRDAAVLGETIAMVRPLLPQSYRVDGKDAGTLIADALVAKKPELAGWVKKNRTDGSMLRGALDMLLTGEKPIESGGDESHTDSEDPVSAAQGKQTARMTTRAPLAAVDGGKK